MGRGGSDYSAGIDRRHAARNEGLDLYGIDSVMNRGSRAWCPSATTVPVCSYREVAELAYYEQNAASQNDCPVIGRDWAAVCNTFNPAPRHPAPFPNLEALHDEYMKAIAPFLRSLQLITIEGHGMLGVPGFRHALSMRLPAAAQACP